MNFSRKVCTSTKVFLLFLRVLSFLFVFSFFVLQVRGKGTEPEYEETFVSLYVDHLGTIEIPAVIRNEREVYLPVVDVFNFLKIKSHASDNFKSVGGFFVSEENTYRIDAQTNRIVYQKKSHALNQEDLLYISSSLFLKLNYFGEIFGLACTFEFRTLAVFLHATSELPAIREKRLENMRKNSLWVQRNFIADTTIGMSNKLFHFGAADWAVNTIQQANGVNYVRLNLNLGATLAGGELRGMVNYSNQHPFLERQQHYFWRYANNNRNALRQVVVGKIHTQPISTILSPVVGVQLSNVPTFRKNSFGTYNYSNYTEPGWMVELYVNNVLINYTKADASGFFVFDIPLAYGNTEAMLRSYGPWGEEKVERINFNIPFNFLPVNEFEYTISSGVVQDGTGSRYSQGRANYGVSRNLTIGGGVEYLSSISQNSIIPFVNSSLSVKPNLLLNGEYAYGVRSKARLSYLSPSKVQVELNYVQYNDAQTAVRYNYTKETNAAVAKSFRVFKASFFSRLTLARNFLNTREFNNINFLLSGSFRNVSMNVATFALSRSETIPFVYSNVSTSVLLPAKVVLNTQTRYVHNDNAISFIQCGVRKNLFGRAVAHATYERDLVYKLNTYQVGFMYNFSFARFDVSAYRSKSMTALFQSVSGSLINESTADYFHFNRNNSVGRGGIIVSAFLDVNGNGKREEGEPKVEGLNVKGNGGRIDRNKQDGTTIISGLEPYTYYFIEVDGNDFDNISWIIRHATFNIMIEPNRLKAIEVPVTVVGEASGMIYVREDDMQKGVGRIKVAFYNDNKRLVAHTLSEPDGFFSYMGLPPGKYTAKIDSVQLKVLQMSCFSPPQSFEINMNENGDVNDGLAFVLEKRKSNVFSDSEVRHDDHIQRDITPEEFTKNQKGADHGQAVSAEDVLDRSDDNGTKVTVDIQRKTMNGVMYRVRIMSAKEKIPSAHPMFKELKDVTVHHDKGIYHYSWGEFTSFESARILENELKERGFSDASIVVLNFPSSDVNEDALLQLSSGSDANTEGLNFRVQVMAAKTRISPRDKIFKNLNNVEVYHHSGMYKYTSGRVKSIEDARMIRTKAEERGFEGSFVVPFFRNERIMIDTLDSTVNHSVSGLIFRLQILTNSEALSQNHPLFNGLKNVRRYFYDDVYQYMWGETSSYKQARKLERELRQKGFTEVAIVPFYRK